MAWRIELHATDDEGFPLVILGEYNYPTEAKARRDAPRVVADTWDNLDRLNCIMLDITYRIVEMPSAQVLAFPRRMP